MTGTRIFTLEGAQRHDAAVEQWFKQPIRELRSIAHDWFLEMRNQGPDVLELLHDGCPTACIGNVALGYVNAFSVHVNVGFFFGSALSDPAGLLQGSGRFMRHAKIRPGQPLDQTALRELVRAAYTDVKARLGAC